ncbi:MAG: hypothetical protein WCQ80_02630 [Bacilli bacterium]
MKTRMCYVSNSSSSSFIIDFDTSDEGISCVKLSSEIVRCLQEHASDANFKKLELNLDKCWYLTEFINDCDNKNYDYVSKNGIRYMDGGFREPYGDEDQYIILKNKSHDEFYLDKEDLVGHTDCVPAGVELSLKVQNVLKSKLTQKQKLECISELVGKIKEGNDND